MDFKAAIEPVLKKHGLVAFLINHGWILIRRKEYIDIYIERQPFNSVEILFHAGTKVEFKLKFETIVICKCNNNFLFYFRRLWFESGAEQLSKSKMLISQKRLTRHSQPSPASGTL